MTFKELLKQNNITQQRLAEELNKSQKLISNWCNGYCEPQVNEILKLQRILNIDIFELLDCFKK